MYKQRFNLWILVLFIVVFVKSIASIDFDTLIVKKTDIGVCLETDTFFKSKFVGTKIVPINFYQTTENPLVTIKKSSNESLEGHKKIANAVYSPIILCVPNDIESFDLYYTLGNNAEFASFKNIAKAILEEKPLSTFGVTDKDFKDKTIVLNIPPKDSFYYEKVVEQMYISLNDNKVPTDIEKENLKPMVDKLLAKSIECNDAAKTIENMESNYNKTYNIFMVPEFVADNCNKIGTSLGYNFFNTIYFEKSSCISYDIFVKEGSLFGTQDLMEAINERVLNDDNFVNSISYRTRYDLDFDNCFYGIQANNLDVYFGN